MTDEEILAIIREEVARQLRQSPRVVPSSPSVPSFSAFIMVPETKNGKSPNEETDR